MQSVDFCGFPNQLAAFRPQLAAFRPQLAAFRPQLVDLRWQTTLNRVHQAQARSDLAHRLVGFDVRDSPLDWLSSTLQQYAVVDMPIGRSYELFGHDFPFLLVG